MQKNLIMEVGFRGCSVCGTITNALDAKHGIQTKPEWEVRDANHVCVSIGANEVKALVFWSLCS